MASMTAHQHPGSEWRPLPEDRTQPLIRPRAIILHSIVGSARGAVASFDKGSLESTFVVLKKGAPWQLMAANRRADANRHANAFAISIETEDNGDPNTDPWTPHQLDQIVDICVWACREYDIPARLIPAWDSSGIGYHTLFGSPSPWTPVAKSCPGRVRIEQFHTVVLPRIIAALGAPAPAAVLPPLSEPTVRERLAVDMPHLTAFHKGKHVELLQAALNVKSGAGLKVDGVFGASTMEAVAAFQRYFGLAGNGEVGPTTWGLLLGLPL